MGTSSISTNSVGSSTPSSMSMSPVSSQVVVGFGGKPAPAPAFQPEI